MRQCVGRDQGRSGLKVMMDMRRARISGAAEQAEKLALGDMVAGFHAKRVLLEVGDHAELAGPVIDDDVIARTASIRKLGEGCHFPARRTEM